VGSLYDIGNFRYKHFTFYSCGDDGCSGPPGITIDDQGRENDEIVNYLDKVWPHRGLFIGDSSEGDYCFVTYVHQTTDKVDVKNIYIYKRIMTADSETSGATDGSTNFRLVWERVLDPVPSLKPGVLNQ